jgi:hypothetical protein
MATTDLKLDNPGSLLRPGPIGRLVRFAYGVVFIWFVVGLLDVSSDLLSESGHIRWILALGLVIGLYLINYIINIGYSRAWKKWPALISSGLFFAIAGIGYLTEGTIQTELLARSLWLWEIYLFLHLGSAYVIASVIGTPGCEMRAYHDLYSQLTGVPTKEHYCPIGPLNPIDQWEVQRSKL